jgi:SAM-dependent methyltransferase
MGLLPFVRRGSDAHALAVSMAGVKMGERFVQIGCENGDQLGAVAARVGLSGQANVVAPDEASAERARRGAARAGVLVEVTVGPPTTLPVDDATFDVAVVDDTGGLLARANDAERQRALVEVCRVLRPGGRTVCFVGGPRTGLRALLGGGTPPPGLTADELRAVLAGAGFKAVRTLAERGGVAFVEGLKPR